MLTEPGSPDQEVPDLNNEELTQALAQLSMNQVRLNGLVNSVIQVINAHTENLSSLKTSVDKISSKVEEIDARVDVVRSYVKGE